MMVSIVIDCYAVLAQHFVILAQRILMELISEPYIPARYILQALDSELLTETGKQHLLSLLEANGLTLKDLEKREACVPAQWINHLIPNDGNMSPPSLALKFGDMVRLTTPGELSFLIMTSATVRDALKTTSYLALYTNALTIEFYESETLGYVCLNSYVNDLLVDSMILCFCVATINRLVFLITGQKPKCKTNLAIEKPNEFDRLTLSANKNWHFGQPSWGILFDKEFLNCPSLFADPVENAVYRRACESALKEKNSDNFRFAIEKLMKNESLWEQDCIAARLHVSRSTLKRRLAEQGITFSEVSISVRKYLSIQLLMTSNYSLQKISETLGYRDQSSFSHAFKKWFGLPPKEYAKLQSLN